MQHKHNMPRQLLPRSSLALALTLSAALACGGDSPTDPPDGTGGTGEPATLVITADSLAFDALGDSTQLAVVVRDAAGGELTGMAVVWTGLDPGVAAVSTTGWVVAQANGTAAVVASAGTLADTVPVAVAQVGAGVEAGPGSVALHALGDSVRLTAVLRDANGNEVAGATVLWTSLEPGVATVRQSGWVVASGNGAAGVVASAGGAADTVEVDVAQAAAAVELIPGVDTLLAQDETLQLGVAAIDSNDVAIETPAVEWASTAAAVAAVDTVGLVTALRGGAAVVSASVDGVSDEAAFTVLDRLAFFSTASGDFEIHGINADGGQPANLTQTAGEDSNPVWSPDGSRIAFRSERDGDPEVYVMNADGTGQVNLSLGGGSFDADPVWSPDGSRIAFRSDRDGNYEVYVMNADGTGQVNLTQHAADDFVAAWSPDGAQLAFVSRRDGNDEIYVMNADGSDPTRLTNNDSIDSKPVWSPDGTRIAFQTGRDGNHEIYVMNADGGGQANLTQDPESDLDPVWSPDGTRIAFTSDRDGNNVEIWVMAADGSDAMRLSQPPGNNRAPAWSPDGTLVAFHNRVTQYDLYVAYADGTDWQPLRAIPGLDQFPVWRPRP